MSVSNIASSLYQGNQFADLTGRIRQRFTGLQDFSKAFQSGDSIITNQTFSSLLQSLNHSSESNQTQAGRQSLLTAGITALREALQAGDKTALQAAMSRLQTDIKAVFPQSSQDGLFAADWKTLREALLAGDETGIQAAITQFQKDIQSAVQAARQTCNQNNSTGLRASIASGRTNSNSDLALLLNSVNTQNTPMTNAVNTGLQQLLRILSSTNVSPVIGAGISGLASLIGKGINTSA